MERNQFITSHDYKIHKHTNQTESIIHKLNAKIEQMNVSKGSNTKARIS